MNRRTMLGVTAGAGLAYVSAGAAWAAQASRPLPDDVVVWGEVGLTGEVRSVARSESRLREAAREGFRRCIVPASNAAGLPALAGVGVHAVRTVDQLLDVLGLAGSE